MPQNTETANKAVARLQTKVSNTNKLFEKQELRIIDI